MKHVYVLIDPNDQKIRYVGCSSNPKARFSQHIKDAQKSKTQKQKWILGLQAKKMLPFLEIIRSESDPAKARLIEESVVIRNIQTIYNIHMPGKGSLSVDHFRKTGKLK